MFAPKNRVLGYFTMPKPAAGSTPESEVDSEAIGLRFSTAQDALGMGNEEVAILAKCHKDTVSNLRTGNFDRKPTKFEDVCEAIGADPEYIWTGVGRSASAEPGPTRKLERLLASDLHDATLEVLNGLYRSKFGRNDRTTGGK